MTITFADLTTMRVGGPVGQFHLAGTTPEAIDLLRAADEAGERVLVIGGGSNLVVGDVGWDGVVVKLDSDELDIVGDRVVAAAGLEWDRLVQAVVADGLAGVEGLLEARDLRDHHVTVGESRFHLQAVAEETGLDDGGRARRTVGRGAGG